MNANVTGLNPFSSRFVSPLSCDYVDDETTSGVIDSATSQLLNAKCLQIVGPHGCGKTTTALQIAKQLKPEMDQICLVTIRASATWRRRLNISNELLCPRPTQSRCNSQQRTTELTIVDGVEQLSASGRLCLTQSLQQRSGYAMFTTHRPFWLVRPQIKILPSLSQFRRIALQLAGRSSFDLSDESIEAVYALCKGDYRLGLGLLYDEYALDVASPRFVSADSVEALNH